MVSLLQIIAGLAGVILGVGLTWLLWRTIATGLDTHEQAVDWYREAIDLCTDALGRIQRFESDSEEYDHDDLRDHMQEMVGELSRHAGRAVQTDVDDDVITALREASLACQELSEARIQIGDASEWEAALDGAAKTLKRAREQAEARLRDA